MKYLKRFEGRWSDDWNRFYDDWEEDDRGEMWKIPLKKPDFYICLNKVEMPNDQQNFWKRSLDAGMYITDMNRKIDSNIKYMILQRSNTGYFTWSRCDKWFDEKDNASYIYKGEMKVTHDEIEDYNYQIELNADANKYNL